MALTLRESICSARKLPRDPAILAGRAELLLPHERELIEAILIRGQKVLSVSRMTGLSPRAVSNRVRKISRRMASRKFLDTARALGFLTREDAAVARLKFCAGVSERKLAADTGLSSYLLRRRLDRISAQIVMIKRFRRAAKRHGALVAHEKLAESYSYESTGGSSGGSYTNWRD